MVSIVDAVNAGDPLERMADGWMAAAAGLDLIAAVAGWALGAAEIATIGGFAVASICSAIGFLGILAALVGVAILLYMIFRPQKNPVQQFGSDYAAPAGFFMPYGSEIDYFNGYTQGGAEPARLGCSFVVDASTRPETVLSVASDGITVEAASQSLRLQFRLRHLDQWNRAVPGHRPRAEQFRQPPDEGVDLGRGQHGLVPTVAQTDRHELRHAALEYRDAGVAANGRLVPCRGAVSCDRVGNKQCTCLEWQRASCSVPDPTGRSRKSQWRRPGFR